MKAFVVCSGWLGLGSTEWATAETTSTHMLTNITVTRLNKRGRVDSVVQIHMTYPLICHALYMLKIAHLC